MGQVRAVCSGLAALVLAGCGAESAENQPPAGKSAHPTYVALGASFAAGPGLPPMREGAPERCTRSTRNYPSLAAAKLGLELDDQSCSGASTMHVLHGWDEQPPQIDAVTAATRLVTITIGGNDVRYVPNLMAATCRPGEGCPAHQDIGEDVWARDAANMRAIVRGIRRRSPRARIVFVDYFTLLPETGSCPAIAMSAADLAVGRATGARLIALIGRVAREEGAEVVPIAALSRGHTACDPEPWIVGAAVTDPAAGGTAWHPTYAGMRAAADALAAHLATRP